MDYQIVLWISLLCPILANTTAEHEEGRLIKQLLSNYDQLGGKFARPVSSVRDVLSVQFGMGLIRANIDSDTGTLTAKIWLRYMWIDALLKWDPMDYGGINDVRIPPQSIWNPDIILFDSIGKVSNDADIPAVVYNSGSVLFIPPVTLQAPCHSRKNNTMTCRLKFGSWTYDGHKIDPVFYNEIDDVDLTDFIPNDTWKLVAHGAKKNVKYYECCKEPYVDLEFTLKFKSKR